MKTNFNNTPQSYKASNMAPLDAKAMVNTLDELKDLGAGNRKAFTYYDSMIVYCHEDKKKYRWTDDFNGSEKLLVDDFTYPPKTVFDSIDYSGRSFNFVEEKDIEDYERKENKQNDLTPDGTGVKYPTVDAVNQVLDNIESDKNFTYDQITPSKEWDILHNLNKKPSVTVTDSANTVVEGRVVINDGVRLLIEFNAPFTGTAILN